MAALYSAPYPRRADPLLQPSYFTSSLYIDPLRADLRVLVNNFQDQFHANTAQPPFPLFKQLWALQGWSWLHFKALDDRSREIFLQVTFRIILESISSKEPILVQVATLFALYTFYATQPDETAPPIWCLDSVAIPIDAHIDLYSLPGQLQEPRLRPVLTSVLMILDNFSRKQLFLLLPPSKLSPQNPRTLPREIYVSQDSAAASSSQATKKKGRPSKNDKAKNLKTSIGELESWIQDTTPPLQLNPCDVDAPSPMEEYTQHKTALLHSLDTTAEGRVTIAKANQLILNRLNEVNALLSDDVSPPIPTDETAGIQRVKSAIQHMEDGQDCGIFELLEGSGLKKYFDRYSSQTLPPVQLLFSSTTITFCSTIFLGMPQRRFYPQASRPSISQLLSPRRQPPSSQPPDTLEGYDPFESAPSTNPVPPVLYAKSNSGSISDKFSLSPDPMTWGSNLSPDFLEADDYLHNPDPRRDVNYDAGGHFCTYRGLTNLGCMITLCGGILVLFAGYPIISHFKARPPSRMGGFNIGGINASGQVPNISGNWGLIDLDTPKSMYAKPSYTNPNQNLELVFSDEFNRDGRSFYPGDDPYWEAVDLHYWATNNLEWYDPEAITTRDGFLQITLSKKVTHGMQYQGGLLSTWNKFCFTGGLLEAAVVLPGANNIMGLWPAIWSMGNLGRAGYGASLEGMWPYTYDACDVGTAPNQTINGLPVAATVNGDPVANGALSYLPGQRLSRCTCPGEAHPGPKHSDGTFVGRAAPEIDVFEAQISGDPLRGAVSQSAQWAPFNEEYTWDNNSDNLIIPNPSRTTLNPYTGGAFQQATSCVTQTNQACYELEGDCASIYGFEYKSGFDSSYISWVADGQLVWTLRSGGMAADPRVGISARPIPQEPMYIIANLGMSENFGVVDFDHLAFPTTMKIDWIRVYQPKNANNIGCDPKDFPTADYINQYIYVYTNPNITTWKDDFQQPFPANRLLGHC